MKIKMPKFLTRKPKKLRATTARRPLRIAATAEYEEMNEPNMKLSRALLIVLVLHVVAVSGIIAFNAIKTRQSATPPPLKTNSASTDVAPAPSKSTGANSRPSTVTKETNRHEEAKASRLAGKPATKDDHKAERAKSPAPASTDTGKVYVVAKGDNPVSIAKKLKVSYDELLALNHIDDPHKLQIGQKLQIPSKKVKKNDE